MQHPPLQPVTQLSVQQIRFLSEAAGYLEHPGFLIKAANLLGKPAEQMLSLLPARAQALAASATRSALAQSLDWALQTLPKSEGSPSRFRLPSGPRFHVAMTATTGAMGGMFGLVGAAVEIPATTTLILRSICEQAAQDGFDPQDPATRLHCLSVLSYGSPTLEAMESAYFTSRIGMALAVRDASLYLARHSGHELGTALSRRTAPVLVRLLNAVATRFEVVISEKLAAQAVPLLGAAMGSLINAAFTDHFQRVARYHFGIVQLERLHGEELVRTAYRRAVEQSRTKAA